MNAPLTRRRFGHGVARLPIGAPHASAAMALAAQRPVGGESLAIAAPLLTASMVLLTLGLFARFEPATLEPDDLAERSETWIELESWTIPEPVEPIAAVEPVVVAMPEITLPVPEISPPSNDVAGGTPQSAETATRPALDPRSLFASTAPTVPTLRTDRVTSDTRTANRRPGGLPTARSLTDLPLAIPRSASAPSIPSRNAVPRAVAATTDPRRSRLTTTTDTAPAPSWQVQAERVAFLEAADREAAAERGSGRAATALPQVSARATLESAAAIRRAWAAEGWHEVPLDALPDCSPPGRQDALKRRIVVAAPSGSECTSAGGSFRFLETRNLNAFLMWSRTHPAGSANAHRDQDVCDVLERALRCLALPATKELDPR